MEIKEMPLVATGVPRTPLQKWMLLVKTVGGLGFFYLLISPWARTLPGGLYATLTTVSVLMTCVDMYSDYRRRRPRQRVLFAVLMLWCLGFLWIAVMPWLIRSLDPSDTETFQGILYAGVVSSAAGLVCFLYWRRLVAKARFRLYELQTQRRKRDRREAINRIG